MFYDFSVSIKCPESSTQTIQQLPLSHHLVCAARCCLLLLLPARRCEQVQGIQSSFSHPTARGIAMCLGWSLMCFPVFPSLPTSKSSSARSRYYGFGCVWVHSASIPSPSCRVNSCHGNFLCVLRLATWSNQLVFCIVTIAMFATVRTWSMMVMLGFKSVLVQILLVS